jgi:hypothetical protein
MDGELFDVVLFTDSDGSRKVGVLFEGRGRCAVRDVDLLGEGDVVFGSNSWPGGRLRGRSPPGGGSCPPTFNLRPAGSGCRDDRETLRPR